MASEIQLSSSTKLTEILDKTKSFLNSLNSLKPTDHEEIIKWYQRLCFDLTELISLMGSLCKDPAKSFAKHKKSSILLYLTQLLTFLAFLINVFVQESETKVIVVEARKYALIRLVWCLDGLRDTLLLMEDIKLDSGGNFIKWMDAALAKISLVDVRQGKQNAFKFFNEAKVLFEEVLCHGMSIAQVAVAQDCLIIKGSSQTVLEALSSLQNELSKDQPNRAVVDLLEEASRNKLCKLEERVNMAVLRLCLSVFSHYTELLNQIYKFCCDSSNVEKTEELESMVADFDLHLDRIMQIGLFAVSCSSESNCGIRIRSCLASLEALETELVPAFSSLLTDSLDESKQYASILKKHWEQQANQLKKLVYRIIDPYAFCKVINQEIKESIKTLQESQSVNSTIFKRSDFDTIIAYGNVLKEFMCVIWTIEADEIQTKNLKVTFREYKSVLHELGVARNILLSPANASLNSCSRIIKRCKILVTTIKNMQNVFLDETEDKENMEQVSSVCAPPENKPTELQNKFLQHIINRGKEILNERSILYRTPMKPNGLITPQSISVTTNEFCTRNKITPLSRNIHNRKLSFINTSKIKEEASTFNITEILNELTNLSDTFDTKPTK